MARTLEEIDTDLAVLEARGITREMADKYFAAKYIETIVLTVMGALATGVLALLLGLLVRAYAHV
jgi:hypothetical protein